MFCSGMKTAMNLNLPSVYLWGHLAAAVSMAAIMVVVEMVSYPLFSCVPAAAFVTYHHAHVRRISVAVGLPLAVQVVTVLLALGFCAGPLVYVCLLLTAVEVALTAFGAVPAHLRLRRGFDAQVYRRLRMAHGMRTAVWVIHSFVLLAAVATGSAWEAAWFMPGG